MEREALKAEEVATGLLRRLRDGVTLLAVVLPGLVMASSVDHHFSFPGLEQQYVRVVSRFPVDGAQLEIRLANWIPGSYKIRDFAGSLDRIAFSGAEGEPLVFEKTSKNSWRVEAGGAEAVVAEYDVHAGVLSVRASWVSPDFVLINPATAVLYSDATRNLPQSVKVDVPDRLGRVHTSLANRPDGAGWLAVDFDELVDSPLVISKESPSGFQVDGHGYQLLNVGGDGLWDVPMSVQGLRAVVEATNEFWGAVPLERDYWFFNLLVEGRGGLEHDHNTVMMTSRWNTRKREDFINWLSLAAHEYFHVWNVRGMRPASLASYDYEDEQYSRSLWFAEGVTSYYDNLLLSRAALISAEEYLKLLAKDLHRLELTPGRQWISLEQASRDAWIRQYGESPNRINSNISYYTKGAVVGFALDSMIREASRDRYSLDDVMRSMYRDWSQTPYPEGAFRGAVEALAGAEIRARLEPLLSATEDPDIDVALAYYGLVLDRHPERTAAEQASSNPGAGFGVNWDTQAQNPVIAATVSGTAASRAGLVPGDELVAINGQRVRKENLTDRLQRLLPGESVELLLSRHERLFEVTLELDLARPERYEIRLDGDAGKKEIARLEAWLGQGLKPQSKD